jgi:lysozyme
MGGPEAMFRHIRVWLKAVEQRTKVKPILYVNQMFVNNYLSAQPDLKRDYRIWIARYSEYKPDLRLTYWQLCPDGRVTGIQGYVDINVFNGYQRQFEEYLAEETIK